MLEQKQFYPNPEKNADNYNDTELIDMIPEGTFYAENNDKLTRERILAIQLVEKISQQLITEHPEITELYEDPSNRLIDIAYNFFPKEYVDQYPEVCSKAVGLAIRQLNSEKKQVDLTKEHRQRLAEINFNLGSQEFIEQCKEAAKKRHELHGVDTEAMIRGRGREPWNLAEKALVNDLINNPDFQHQAGSIKGTPNYQKIAEELNQLFHEEENIRTSNSVGSLVRDSRRKK